MEDCAHVMDSDVESDAEDDLDNVEDIDGIPIPSKQRVTNNYNLLSGKQVKRTCPSMRMCTVKKRAVTTSTVEKWEKDYERTLNTSLWLDYERWTEILSLH